MAFTLTRERVLSIFDGTGKGDWTAFVESIDPNVRWWIASDVKDPLSKSGIYVRPFLFGGHLHFKADINLQNLQQWIDEVNKDLRASIKDGYAEMKLNSLDIVGLKAIAECSGFAVQTDGEPYQNRFAWFFTFSAETGKIVEIHEYMHTALTKEMFSKLK
jgi:ketosteroid isomerase-like protein